jgi:hypothetical protein
MCFVLHCHPDVVSATLCCCRCYQALALISTSSWRLGRPLLADGVQARLASRAALMAALWSSSSPSLALSGQVDGTGRI